MDLGRTQRRRDHGVRINFGFASPDSQNEPKVRLAAM